MRFLGPIFTVLVVIGLGAAGWSWFKSRSGEAVDTTPMVRVEPATRGSLTEYISAPGEVQPRRKVSISARVAARIMEIPFKEGDRVEKDKVLVRLDGKELDSALKSVEARRAAEEAQKSVSESHVDASRSRIDALKVTLADARRELDRNKGLLASQDVSQSAVDQLQSKVDQQVAEMAASVQTLRGDELNLVVLQHNIDAAAAEIERARDNQAYTVITSPIEGTVTRVNAEVGELVMTGTMNNAGTVILEVSDLSEMIIDARVDENSIAAIHKGQPCKIRMEAYRDKVFTGEVRNVALANYDPQFDRGRSSGMRSGNSGEGGKTFKVEILLNTNGQTIFSGLSADADIETKHFDDVIKVPSQAVLGRAPDTLPEEMRKLPEVDASKATVPVVYIFKDGKAEVRPVSIGASDLTHTVIKSGLKKDDPVITGPYKALEALQDGQKVKAEFAVTRPATTTTTTSPATKSASTAPASMPTSMPSTSRPTSRPASPTPPSMPSAPRPDPPT